LIKTRLKTDEILGDESKSEPPVASNSHFKVS
jgi:hypothetical protein